MPSTVERNTCRADKIPTHKIPTDKIPNDFSDVFVAIWDFVDMVHMVEVPVSHVSSVSSSYGIQWDFVPKQSHAESLDNLCAILYHVKLNFTMYCVRMSQVRLIVMGPLLPFKLLNFDASKLAP